MWLFNDSERVSSDCLFRMRDKQPFEEKRLEKPASISNNGDSFFPSKILDHTKIGDVSVFEIDGVITIGKILQFTGYNSKGKEKDHHGSLVLDAHTLSCSIMCDGTTTAKYYPINTYLCHLNSNELLHSLGYHLHSLFLSNL